MDDSGNPVCLSAEAQLSISAGYRAIRLVSLLMASQHVPFVPGHPQPLGLPLGAYLWGHSEGSIPIMPNSI